MLHVLINECKHTWVKGAAGAAKCPVGRVPVLIMRGLATWTCAGRVNRANGWQVIGSTTALRDGPVSATLNPVYTWWTKLSYPVIICNCEELPSVEYLRTCCPVICGADLWLGDKRGSKERCVVRGGDVYIQCTRSRDGGELRGLIEWHHAESVEFCAIDAKFARQQGGFYRVLIPTLRRRGYTTISIWKASGKKAKGIKKKISENKTEKNSSMILTVIWKL